jgi:hypothetical protein
MKMKFKYISLSLKPETILKATKKACLQRETTTSEEYALMGKHQAYNLILCVYIDICSVQYTDYR